MAWVPFTRARPSFASSTTGSSPARRSASRPGSRSPRKNASPSPISTRARCARGARSPLAPTEPFSGTTGMTSRSSSATRRSSVLSRIPLYPPASTFARRSISARTACDGKGAPTPAACEWSRLRCNLRRSGRAMGTSASVPNPVFTPYVGTPLSAMRSTSRRAARTRSRAAAAISTCAPPAAASATCSSFSEFPSRTMRTQVVLPLSTSRRRIGRRCVLEGGAVFFPVFFARGRDVL